MNKSKYKLIAVALFISIATLTFSSCNLPDPALATDPAPENTPLDTEPPPIADAGDLPDALYFLSDETGAFQVWRLAADGIARTQLTNTPQNINAYAVSTYDGTLAYIIGNQIYLRHPDGTESLLIDGSEADKSTDEYYYYEEISGLAWMPNAPVLAYGQNGIHLYNLETGENTHPVQNVVDMLDSGYFNPRALYYPYVFSPEGDQLLMSVGFVEGGRLSVLQIDSDQITDLGEGIVCCQASWHSNGQSVFVASPVTGLFESGLWQYNSLDGEKITLLPNIAEDGTLNFAGWPHLLPDGTLRFFYTNTATYPAGEPPLSLVSVNITDLNTLTLLRAEAWQIREALWFPDGSGVIMVLPPFGVSEWTQYGPVVRVGMQQSAPIPLVTNGYSLQWGP